MVSIFASISTRWRNSLPTVFSVVFGLAIILSAATLSNAQSFTEGFDVVPVVGWTTQNNSTPIGSVPGWFQGNTAVFPAQTGATTSYIGANFNNTTGTNTISNWLVAPNRTMVNGDVYKFWTRTVTANPFPDRMQVRLSTAGASTNVGTGPMGIGDFTTLLLDINPLYDLDYPEVWTEFTITISGLAGPTSGRLAFRYFVENGGPAGDNSNFIGIDTFSYTSGPAVAADGPVDYNGDGRSDYVVARNTGGGAAGQLTWYYNPSSGGPTVAKLWGIASDSVISGNWDADNSDDIAVWRPGAAGVAAFYVLRSTDFTALVELFGQTGDDPSVVDDYSGDGKTDFSVYRSGVGAGQPSTWFYRSVSGGPVTYVLWGQTGDFPAPGDYDGNGSADFVVQRDNGGGQARFWTRLSTGATSSAVFGTPLDTVTPGDYDGDGKTDIAVARGISGVINWFYDPSGTPATDVVQNQFGASATDSITQGDYNGDGKTDRAIWRNGIFWVDNSGGAVTNFQLGATGDVSVASFNTH